MKGLIREPGFDLPTYSGMALSTEYFKRDETGIEPSYLDGGSDDFKLQDVESILESSMRVVENSFDDYRVLEKRKYIYDGGLFDFEVEDHYSAQQLENEGMELKRVESEFFLEVSGKTLAEFDYFKQEDETMVSSMKPGRIMARLYQEKFSSSHSQVEKFFREIFSEKPFLDENF